MHAVDGLVFHHHDEINGVAMHWVEAGEGPLVVLLHGFPEFWYSWREQIPRLADAGYRVIAPDLRGFAWSAKPDGYDAYGPGALTGDVIGLIEVAGAARATVVGHDWGGAIAWWTAQRHADRVERLVVANSPHPAVFAAHLRRPVQLARSAYIGFFQLPVVPEVVLQAGNFAVLRRFLTTATKPGTVSRDDLGRYVEAWAQPKALTAALSYYRAAGRAFLHPFRDDGPVASRRVEAPTLVIWGRRDPALGVELADPGEFVADRRVVIVDDAGHFVHADAADTFNSLLLNFLDT